MHSGDTQPWWERLPADLHRDDPGTELDARHRLRVTGAAALDHVLRSTVSVAASAMLGPMLWSRKRLQQEVEQWRFYEEIAARADAQHSFPAPANDIEVAEVRSGFLGYHPSGLPHRMLRFESPFEARNPALRQSYADLPRNRHAWAQHWYHPDGPRPTLIAIHGFLADAYRLNSRMLRLRWFYEQGYDVLLYTLPFHGHRAERMAPFSGFGLLAYGVGHFNEGMAQAVHDLRVFVRYLRDAGVRQVGVTGLSLGGYTSALLATVDPELSFALPLAPVVSPADLARDWQPLGLMSGVLERHHGVSLVQLRRALAFQSPLSYAPVLPAERMLIVAGAGDRLTPPWQVRMLQDHWRGCRLIWYPGNHFLHLQQDRYLQQMKAFMDRHCAD